MTDEELKVALKARISRLYGELTLRPQLFTRSLTVESFILALECILDYLEAGPRPDTYTAFLRTKNFGMHLFLSMFEMRHSCTLTLVEQQGGGDSQNPALEAKYIEAVKEHLKEFLVWRESHQK